MKTPIYLLLFINLISFHPVVETTAKKKNNTLIRQFCQDIPKSLLDEYMQSIDYLKKRQLRFRRDLPFLKHIFYYVHRKHLKHFTPYSSMNELLQDGAYDCVSGTSLFAVVLDELGFRYQIWEMNYHVYLSVQLDQTRIVFEATEPLKGFIIQSDQIDQHLQFYTEEARQYLSETDSENELMHQEISLTQLVGLQFYNQAIEAMQNQNFEGAERHAKQAMRYYPARRIEELLYLAKNE